MLSPTLLDFGSYHFVPCAQSTWAVIIHLLIHRTEQVVLVTTSGRQLKSLWLWRLHLLLDSLVECISLAVLVVVWKLLLVNVFAQPFGSVTMWWLFCYLDRCLSRRMRNVLTLLVWHRNSFRLDSLHSVRQVLENWHETSNTSRTSWQFIVSTGSHRCNIILIVDVLLIFARLVVIHYLPFTAPFVCDTVLHHFFVERTTHSLLHTDSSIAARTCLESFEWVVGLDEPHILWYEGCFFLV